MNQIQKQCKYCKKEVDFNAKKCSYCQSDLRNWFVRHWIISLMLFAFIGIPFLSGIISSFGDAKKTAQIVKDNNVKEEVKTKATFDVTGLASSIITDVITKLGEPTSKYMPPQARLDDGEKPDITYKKDGEELIISYNNKTKKIIDWFLPAREGHTDINKGEDKDFILNKLGLTQSNTEYKVQYVKSLKDENQFTGVILTKLDPLADVKENNALHKMWKVAELIPLTAPSTAKWHKSLTVKKVSENVFENSGSVDSQNGFGAMLTSYWTIRVKYVGEEKTEQIDYISHPNNWEVIYLEFGGKVIINKK